MNSLRHLDTGLETIFESLFLSINYEYLLLNLLPWIVYNIYNTHEIYLRLVWLQTHGYNVSPQVKSTSARSVNGAMYTDGGVHAGCPLCIKKLKSVLLIYNSCISVQQRDKWI